MVQGCRVDQEKSWNLHNPFPVKNSVPQNEEEGIGRESGEGTELLETLVTVSA